MATVTLTDDDQRELLRIARITLRERLASGLVPPGRPHRATLLAPATVVLRLLDGAGTRADGQSGTAQLPRYRAVQKAALHCLGSAPPPSLTLDDLESLVIELSITSDGGTSCFDDRTRLPGRAR